MIVHDGSALMTWCVGNAKVEPRGNAILITKQASGTAKIDPLMAMFDAVQLMAQNPAPPGSKFQFMVLRATSSITRTRQVRVFFRPHQTRSNSLNARPRAGIFIWSPR